MGSYVKYVKIEEGKIRKDSQEGQKIGSKPNIVRILQRIGIKNGQTILDFGCGSGTYTIPVAKIVGKEGKVYALDKDKNALDNLMKKAKLDGLKNIRRIATSGELRIELPDESVDVSIIFDVFHRYYFHQIDDRKRLLDEIYRITKTNGFVSVWPKHMESEARDEIEGANFYMEREYFGTLIHDNKDIETGKVINFIKKSRYC
ncbi:MAG: class I SAM-dependent methyltransferase [Deltaproteobacteria bacterium]|nr:class I SAM-dependent methyltransferase [Deltaproteobacteria bacterium]